MIENGQTCRRDWGSLVLCLLLSLLLHAGFAWALDWLPRGSGRQPQRPVARTVRHVQVVRASAQKKEEAPKPENPPPPREPERPFAKTPADEQERRPEHADFIGSHDSVASGEPDAPQRQSDAPVPTMAGRDNEEEIVTFDQKRQDGDPAHEGQDAALPTPPPTPVAQGSPDAAADAGAPQEEGSRPPQPATGSTASASRKPPTPGEGLKLGELSTEEALTLCPELPPPPPVGLPNGQVNSSPSSSARSRTPMYDPALAAGAQQPGLRTYERRTRSTGRFIFGRRPALNVASTVRGRYEAEIYRRIARMWYAACDEHRGDIIPGSITVSLRLTKGGSIDSMELVRRRGASLIQQSFSFGAIRRAALPSMPPEVQREVVGRLYEMILTFNFD